MSNVVLRFAFTAVLLLGGAGCSVQAGSESSRERLGRTRHAVEEADAGASVSADKSSYDVTEQVLATFSGLPGSNDWLAVAPAGSALGDYRAWTYVNGETSGSRSLALTGLSGTFVLRAFTNDGLELVSESAPFTVANAAFSLTTNASSYATGAPVTVDYANLPGNPHDWIAIAPFGSAMSAYATWTYASGASGSASFEHLPAGTYVARAFENDSSTLLRESAPFTIADGPLGVAASAARYTTSEPVVISFSTLPNPGTDWIAITTPGAPATAVLRWGYSHRANGTISFAGLKHGTYVARAFANDGYELLAESTPFTVAIEGLSIATSASGYLKGAPVVVTFANLPGNARDWLAVAPVGSPLSTYGSWQYVSGASGETSFERLSPGEYVIRAFENDGLDLLGESAPFSITTPPRSLKPTAASYTTDAPVVVEYVSLPNNPGDWLTIAPAGSPLTSYAQWRYVFRESGSASFSGLRPGSYVARVLAEDSYTLIEESSPFTISMAGLSLTTGAAAYGADAPISVSFANLPGNAQDWIAIARQGDPAGTYVTFQYAGGASGTLSFPALDPGTYVVRAFENDSSTLLGESAAFTVAANVAATKATFSGGEPVTVSYGGLPGNDYDYVAIAPVGDPPGSYVAYRYTYGQKRGTMSFAGIPAGTYVVRAFLDNSMTTVHLESASFTVEP